MPLTVQQRDFASLLTDTRHVHAVTGTEHSGTTIAAVFPGSFHPLHAGHREIAKIACDILTAEIHYEISISNVDKPDLSLGEVRQRLQQFTENDAVCLTRAATFVEKATLFPGATFVTGVDTLWRIVQPCYYEGSRAAMLAAAKRFAESDCRFLVFGRLLGKRFHELDRLELPPSLRELCRGVDESRFRNDISSTELRQRDAANSASPGK